MTKGSVAVRVRELSKEYRIGHRIERYKTLRESLASLVSAPARLLRRRRRSDEGDDVLWALRDVSFDVQPGRGRRHHRPQRRRQEHAAEDPLAHHRADARHGRDPRPRRLACWRSAPASTPS